MKKHRPRPSTAWSRSAIQSTAPALTARQPRHVIREVRPALGVSAPEAQASMPSGKTPTDVFAYLRQASLQLDGLAIHNTGPFDVYRVALTMVAGLDKIWDAGGVTGEVTLDGRHSGKRPGDVYENAYQLLAEIRALTAQVGDFAIPGGVVMPNRRSGDLTPAHVLEPLNKVSGHIHAIKITGGATAPTAFALPAHSETTPSNVFDAIGIAPHPALLPSGKTPSDVYELLHLTSLQLDALGETDIRPFHVYRVALTVIHELDDIWDHVGLTEETHLVAHRGLGLQESYVEAMALMADLRDLTQEDRFAIPAA